MTILDFPLGGRGAAHPTFRHRSTPAPQGSPPSGRWLVTYEELAACCAEVLASSRERVYDAEWEELLDWIRSRLTVLDELKAAGAS